MRLPFRLVDVRYREQVVFAAVFFATAALYMASLQPDIAFWDTAEMQTVPFVLGLAHSNGFPTEILSGWVFSHVFLIGTPAARLTVYNALLCAISSALCSIISSRLGSKTLLSCACGLGFATTALVWEHATHVDVVDPAVMFSAAAVASALAVIRSRSKYASAFTGLLAGFALGTHLIVIFFLPLAFGIILVSPEHRRLRVTLLFGTAFLTAVALYSYLPIRSHFVEQSNLIDTKQFGFGSAVPIWDWGAPHSVQNFVKVVTGSSVSASGSLRQIFDVEKVPQFVVFAFTQIRSVYGLAFSLILVAIALSSFLRLRSQALTVAVWLAPIALITPFAVTFTAESDVQRYFIFPLLCLWASIGAIITAWNIRIAVFSKVVPVSILAFGSWQTFIQRGEFAGTKDLRGSSYISQFIRETSDNSVTIVPWVYGTPLTYARYVERSLGERYIILGDFDRIMSERSATWPTKNIYVISETPPRFRASHMLQTFELGAPNGRNPHLYSVK